MTRRWGWIAGAVVMAASLFGSVSAQGPAAGTALRFEVTIAAGLLSGPADGRVVVVLGRAGKNEPRQAIGETGMDAAPLLGADARQLAAGGAVVLDQRSALFPIAHLAELPARTYAVQAVLMRNGDLNRPGAPGNLYSDVQTTALDPARGGTVRLELTRAVPAEKLPADTDDVKYLRLHSELLSRFHGRPMFLRAAVILPRDFARDGSRHYPLRVHTGGYGTRFTAAGEMMNAGTAFRKLWYADDTPRMLLLHLDGAGPYGDPYQVNSANNGPYGDAILQELIPHVERTFRGIGSGRARVLDGASTGGWVSLALQVFYPDAFNGAWSHAPDPVDFRAYELIDIYRDANAYVNRHGFERPSSRQRNGDTRTTVRHECLMERVLGRGDRWVLSGKDWCAWNATFGPRGADGLPRPLWDGHTGDLDRSVVEHWKQYDLRTVLQKNWPALAPKLRGKLHVWVGEADDYFLNNAVHLLDDFLQTATPAYGGTITYGPGQGHGWRGISERDMMHAMAAAVGAQ